MDWPKQKVWLDSYDKMVNYMLYKSREDIGKKMMWSIKWVMHCIIIIQIYEIIWTTYNLIMARSCQGLKFIGIYINL